MISFSRRFAYRNFSFSRRLASRNLETLGRLLLLQRRLLLQRILELLIPLPQRLLRLLQLALLGLVQSSCRREPRVELSLESTSMRPRLTQLPHNVAMLERQLNHRSACLKLLLLHLRQLRAHGGDVPPLSGVSHRRRHHRQPQRRRLKRKPRAAPSRHAAARLRNRSSTSHQRSPRGS